MFLRTLVLKNFRNYENAAVTFDPGVNLIAGDNAQGKSNLIEAIAFVMTGRSFRTARLKDLIRQGTDSFYIEAIFVKNGIEQTIKIGYDGTDRRILHNDTQLPSFASLIGIVQGQLISPEDRQLISGSPSIRRRFLDLHLAQTDPHYLHHLSRYYRALKHRNQLLQHKQAHTLSTWEEQMQIATDYLAEKRDASLRELNALLSAQDEISLKYQKSAPQWEKDREKEFALGHTLTGPHRDDFGISLDQKKARHFGSEGQKITAAIALRLAEWTIVHKSANEKPLMLIDDIGGSLDPTRKKTFYHHLKECGQIFLTAPHPLELPFPCQEFNVRTGVIAAKTSLSTTDLL